MAAAADERLARIVAAPDVPVRIDSAKVLNTGSVPLVLLYAAPPDYVRALERKKELNGDSAAAEREIFGVTHAEVGAYLLGLWGIPFPIVEAVAFHHRPNEVAPESRPLVAAVHIASGLIEEMTESGAQRVSGAGIDSSARIDVSFLREAGLEEVFKKSRSEAEKLIGKTA